MPSENLHFRRHCLFFRVILHAPISKADDYFDIAGLFFRRPEDLINHSAYFVDRDTRGIEYVVGRFVQKILQGVLI